MSFKHVIICRVNMPRELDPFKYDDPAPYKSEDWNKRRIELLNTYTRPSLVQQTSQNFELITLWGNHHPIDRENKLDNERQFVIERGIDEEDEKPFNFKLWKENGAKQSLAFYKQIRDLMRELYQPSVLFTNLDSDDCLHYKYVETIQNKAVSQLHNTPFYIDVICRYLMHLKTKGQGKKCRNAPSPMVSVLENEIECYPLRYPHSLLNQYIDGVNVKDLKAMQTVGDTNIFTRGLGDSTTFNTNDYF